MNNEIKFRESYLETLYPRFRYFREIDRNVHDKKIIEILLFEFYYSLNLSD